MKKLFTMVLLLATTAVFAEGYQVNLQSTKQLGMGHTGVAQKLGAEGMHFNPATMSYIDNYEVSLGGTGIISKVKFNGTVNTKNTTAETDNPIGTPIYGYFGCNVLNHKLFAGVSVTNPYGSTLDWGVDWPGAMFIQQIKLQTFSFQPTLSYKILDNLSVGAGVMITTGSENVTKALIRDVTSSKSYCSVELDGKAKTMYGYNVGILYEPFKNFSIGVSYRSEMTANVDKGDSKLSFMSDEIRDVIMNNPNYAPYRPMLAVFNNTKFSAELPLPANLTIGASYNHNNWLFTAEAQMVFWEKYKELIFNFDNPKFVNINTKKYKNTTIFRVGTSYSGLDSWVFRGGFYYDPTPVNKEFYSPETPGANKLGLTAGISWAVSPNIDINGAFAYVFGKMKKASITEPGAGTITGEYKSSAANISLGAAFRF